MSDLSSSKKICGTCGKEIKDGQAYTALAVDFKFGKDDTLNLLTKPHKWKVYHNTTVPSSVPVECIPKKVHHG
jgi:hypothetical protein